MAKKILVIDDDRLVVKSLAKLLTAAGYNVSCAQNENEAVELVNTTGFDLLISDIRIPGKDGIEIASDIEKNIAEKNEKMIPVIFITGYSDPDNYDKAKKLKASDFIYKPFDRDRFLQAIKSVIGEA